MTRLVRQFHEAFDQPTEASPTQPDEATRDLRVRLILEEAAEVVGALHGLPERDTRTLAAALVWRAEVAAFERSQPANLADVTKELADLRYVTDGAAVALGLPLDEAFEIVHRSNMSKLGEDGRPIRREDGKALKGPNYEPAEPAITALLERDPVAAAYGENSGY